MTKSKKLTKKASDIRVGDRIYLAKKRLEVTVTEVGDGIWGKGKDVSVRWEEGFDVLDANEDIQYYP